MRVRIDTKVCSCQTKEEAYEYMWRQSCLDANKIWKGIHLPPDERCVPRVTTCRDGDDKCLGEKSKTAKKKDD